MKKMPEHAAYVNLKVCTMKTFYSNTLFLQLELHICRKACLNPVAACSPNSISIYYHWAKICVSGIKDGT